MLVLLTAPKNLEIIERQPELSNLATAQDVLYSALDLDEPIQITASHGIDEYCAAHIIHQTLETYLDHTAQLQFLPPDENDVTQMANGVHILIGDFSEIGESGRDASDNPDRNSRWNTYRRDSSWGRRDSESRSTQTLPTAYQSF